MPEIGQLFTSGEWLVKPGKESDFIGAWDSFARWTGQNQAGVGAAHLLQDTTNSRRFLSFSPWAASDAIERWRDQEEFQVFLETARELCDDIKPRTLKLVALERPRD